MNGALYKKVHCVEKPFPGCLGRMVNLFDLTGGVNGNKLLTDRPHRHASSLSRSQSDVARFASPTLGDQIEDKLILEKFLEVKGGCHESVIWSPEKMKGGT